jgi:hypothetical protein
MSQESVIANGYTKYVPDITNGERNYECIEQGIQMPRESVQTLPLV